MELVDFYLKVTYGGYLFTIFTDHCLFFLKLYLQITVLSACSFVWGPEASGLNFEIRFGEEKRAVESTCLPIGPWSFCSWTLHLPDLCRVLSGARSGGGAASGAV